MNQLLVLVLGMLIASTAFAQPPEQRNDLFAGIGDAGVIFMMWDLGEEIVGTVVGTRYGDQEGGFQVVAGYQRWLSPGTSAGFTGSWAGSRKTAFRSGTATGKVERRLLTIMVDGRAHWFRRPNVELYTGLAAGVGEMSDDLVSVPDESGTYFTFHLIPIGVRFGREWAGFFETGFGLNGFVKAGLSRRY